MNGGPGWTRTSEGISQQIYSLPRLTASVPTHSDVKYHELPRLPARP